MMENGLRIKPKDMVNIFMLMAQSMKGHGKMISRTAKEKRNGQMAHLTKASTKMGISTEKEPSHGQMHQVIQVSLKTI